MNIEKVNQTMPATVKQWKIKNEKNDALDSRLTSFEENIEDN